MSIASPWLIAGLVLIGYVLGSLPAGYLVGRQLKGIDIRAYGSGSTGATNVLRILGKGPGAAVLAFDIFKGFAAVWIARAAVGGDQASAWVIVLVGLAAVVGHSWPVWLGFRGGKSVAVSIGLLFGMHLPVALAVAGVWAAVFGLTRIVSLGSILGAIAAPIFFLIWGAPPAYVFFGLVGGGYVVWRHRGNLGRLSRGTEPRIGNRASRTS